MHAKRFKPFFLPCSFIIAACVIFYLSQIQKTEVASTVFSLEPSLEIGEMTITPSGEHYFTVITPPFFENEPETLHEYRLCRRLPTSGTDLELKLECLYATSEEILDIAAATEKLFLLARKGTVYTLSYFYLEQGSVVPVSTIPGPVQSLLVLDDDTICAWSGSRQFLSIDGGHTWADVKKSRGQTFVTQHNGDLFFLRETMLTAITRNYLEKGLFDESVLWRQPGLKLGYPLVDDCGNFHCVSVASGLVSLYTISGEQFTVEKLPIDTKVNGTLKLLHHDANREEYYFKMIDSLAGTTNIIRWSPGNNTTLYGQGFNSSLHFLCASNTRLYFREVTPTESKLVVVSLER